ncbi:MAG: dephospho-CoA kinase [Gammaproteobacteria bacterium]
MKPPMVVGLTGGIASGKTTVADLLASFGVPVIDADVLARELVRAGKPAFDEVVTTFGRDILDAQGGLDRGRLRTLVFADPEKRRRLEAILHPRVRAEMRRRVRAIAAPYCVLSIPLLLESGQQDLVDRIVVVEAPLGLQIARAQRRDGTDTQTLEAMVNAQASRTARRAAADDIIDNSGDLAELRAQVMMLHVRYLQLAAADLPSRPD